MIVARGKALLAQAAENRVAKTYSDNIEFILFLNKPE